MPRAKVAVAPYTTTIMRAGALLPDTMLLLAHWDMGADVPANLRRIQEENLFGKTSRARVAELLGVFRRRYLDDADVLAGLVTLVRAGVPASVLNPILYFQAVRADPLLRAVVLEVLGPLRVSGQVEVGPGAIERWARQQVAAGRTQGSWQPATLRRLAVGILASLRDFGLLQGKATKRFAPLYLAPEAFALIALQLGRKQRSGDKLLHEPAWELFFLSTEAVEHLFLEAHQEGLLGYHAAGRVIRVEFGARSLEEYARALAERQHRPA